SLDRQHPERGAQCPVDPPGDGGRETVRVGGAAEAAMSGHWDDAPAGDPVGEAVGAGAAARGGGVADGEGRTALWVTAVGLNASVELTPMTRAPRSSGQTIATTRRGGCCLMESSTGPSSEVAAVEGSSTKPSLERPVSRSR